MIGEVCSHNFFCVVPPVGPTLELEILNGTGNTSDEDVTRVLAVIGSRVAMSCKMTEAYTNNLRMYWSSAFFVRVSATEVHLVIDEVDRNDNRTYYCHAINDVNATLRSVNLIVGSVPEPFQIIVTSSSTILTVMWQDENNTTHNDNIIAYYVKYRSTNDSIHNNSMVKKIASSVQTVTFRNVKPGVEYAVTVWSENIFGNSSANNEVLVVTSGTYITP